MASSMLFRASPRSHLHCSIYHSALIACLLLPLEGSDLCKLILHCCPLSPALLCSDLLSILTPTELFLAPGPLHLLCSLLAPVPWLLALSPQSSGPRGPSVQIRSPNCSPSRHLHISFIPPTQSRIILFINYVLAYCLSSVEGNIGVPWRWEYLFYSSLGVQNPEPSAWCRVGAQ